MANAEEIDSPDWEEPPSTTSSLGRALEEEILPRRLFGGELATEASPQQESMVPLTGPEIDDRGRERTPRPLSRGRGDDNQSLVPQRRNQSDRLARPVGNSIQNGTLLVGT